MWNTTEVFSPPSDKERYSYYRVPEISAPAGSAGYHASRGAERNDFFSLQSKLPSDVMAIQQQLARAPAPIVLNQKVISTPNHVWKGQSSSILYVGATLKRMDLTSKWGLSITLIDNTYLQLGNVGQRVERELTTWFNVTRQQLDPNIMLCNNASTIHDYENKLRTTFNQIAEALPLTQQRLLPGDAIVAVNGRAISSFTGGTEEVLHYVRNQTHLTIFGVRHYEESKAIATAPPHQYQTPQSKHTDKWILPCQNNVDSSLFLSNLKNPCRRSLLPQLAGATTTSNSATSVGLSVVRPTLSTNNGQLYSCPNLLNTVQLLNTNNRTENQITQYQSRPTTSSVKSKIRRPFIPTTFLRWTNPLFRGPDGKPLPFSDNDFEFDPEDGTRSKLYIVPIKNFPNWLTARKQSWRKRWKTYKYGDSSLDFTNEEDDSIYEQTDFWTKRQYQSFDHWLSTSTTKWKRSYSWNKNKRKRIEMECEEVVHFPTLNCQHFSPHEAEKSFHHWLRIRKNQWRIIRRKRQRRQQEVAIVQQSDGGMGKMPGKDDMVHIDALLEERERKRKALDDRPPLDISFIFDSDLGAPDDAVAHCLLFLNRSEHGRLLCISKGLSLKIKTREHLWRMMCPPHWTLPRRPRKPWHDLYITKMRQEEEASRKRSDDLLTKAVAILTKGDHLLKIQKLVNDGEIKFGFNIDYCSGVVCERNSILNLAVINGRHKCVKWLVEKKGPDMESFDRGKFTPLLNAAWAGDKYLVRFLLSKGADRTKLGTGHYTKPLAPPDFEGLTAEGWARKKGHDDIADLIKLGL